MRRWRSNLCLRPFVCAGGATFVMAGGDLAHALSPPLPQVHLFLFSYRLVNGCFKTIAAVNISAHQTTSVPNISAHKKTSVHIAAVNISAHQTTSVRNISAHCRSQ